MRRRGGTFSEKKFPLALPFKKLLKNGLVKFLVVLFYPSGTVFLMEPLPHMTDIILFYVEAGGPRPSPTGFNFPSRRNPSVFAVLFEAAKAKSALCDSRVRFSQMISSFGGSTRYRGDMGVLPHERFLWFVSLSFDKEMNNNLIKVRKVMFALPKSPSPVKNP
jgi:hypothetical protein